MNVVSVNAHRNNLRGIAILPTGAALPAFIAIVALRGLRVGLLVSAIAAWSAPALARDKHVPAPPPSPAAPVPARIVIPIERSVIPPNGLVRYWVPVTIGGIGPIRALLDTGSTGLLVLDTGLEGKSFPMVGRFDYGFDSGENLAGTIAQAKLAIGDLRSAGPVRIGIVRRAKCLKDKPKCLAASPNLQDYTIGGDGKPGSGFKALIGIALDHILIANPLFALGASRWIVALPQPGSPGPGALIVNPNDTDLLGFRRYPIGRQAQRLHGAMRASLPGCLAAPAASFELCGQIGLDTGAPNVYVKVATLPQIASAPGPQRYSLGLSVGEAKLEIPVEESRATGRLVYFERTERLDAPVINAGVFPYFSYLVLYDFAANEIGFKQR